MRSCSKSPATE